MAAVRSLGLHKPSGLQYLIDEGFLPEDVTESRYRWETYDDRHGFEEVLAVDRCVVWSRGGTVKKAFNFDAECETVKHAVLTWFPSDDIVTNIDESGSAAETTGTAKPSMKGLETGPSRALVVFLNRQAHIYFLSGATHLVHLHFDVERVFPAPKGLVIERKPNADVDLVPSTPILPTAPPPSFLSPFVPRIGQTQPVQNGFKAVDTGGLDFDTLRRSKMAAADSLPRHFSLTSPLSEVGLIVHGNQPSFNASSQTRPSDAMAILGINEEILYVSRRAETQSGLLTQGTDLMLVVTGNKDRQLYTVWQALYADSKSASLLFRKRQPSSSGTKTRRRSSFITQTGATTPALRTAEGVNDTFTVKKRGKKLSMVNASQSTAMSEVSADDILASQLDPDFDSRQPAKASRRVSSMLSRAELSTNQDRSAFQELATQTSNRQSFGPHNRRGQSLGGAYADRASFGLSASQRRIRSSTPGAFSRLSLDDASETGTLLNFGPEDTMMTDDADDYDDMFSKHNELDAFDFRLPSDGLRRELLFHRVSEIPMSESLPLRYSFGSVSQASLPSSIQVFTSASPNIALEGGGSGQRHYLHIMNKESRELLQMEYTVQIQRRPNMTLEPAERLSNFESVSVVFPKGTCRLKGIVDAMNITDRDASRILIIKERENKSRLQLYAPWAPELSGHVSLDRLRIYSPFDNTAMPASSPRSVGKQRTMTAVKPLVALLHGGADGCLSLRDADDELHRIQVQLAPRDERLQKLHALLLFVLPKWSGDLLLRMWWDELRSTDSGPGKEWAAFASAMLCMGRALAEATNKDDRPAAPGASPSKRSKSTRSLEKLAEVLSVESEWDVSEISQATSWSWAIPEAAMPAKGKRGAVGSGQKRTERSQDDLLKNLKGSAELLKLAIPRLLMATHLFLEEQRMTPQIAGSRLLPSAVPSLQFVIAQLARWMDWEMPQWSIGQLASVPSQFEDIAIPALSCPEHPLSRIEPPVFAAWIEKAISSPYGTPFPLLDAVFGVPLSPQLQLACDQFFPRMSAFSRYIQLLDAPGQTPERNVQAIAEAGITPFMLRTLPEAFVAPLKDAVVRCQLSPPTIWTAALLDLIAREDLALLASGKQPKTHEPPSRTLIATRDTHTICQGSDVPNLVQPFPEHSDRLSVARLIFNEDRRLTEAMHIVEPLRTAVALCPQDPSWSEAQMLEAQKDVIQWVMVRTFALAPGNGMTHFDSRHPLLTEKYAIHGYTMLCKMQPMGNTVSADRTLLTEDKYGWSWFHAGVAAGLSISKHAKGIDTSWIIFNRPAELTNRHAGLLLALGLNGHLKNVARWLCFKYLTPKHTMTSIGLLLGLSASHLGTMDTLVTRLLSVHVTRMLPPGAAELNLSPLTQTAGLMGIGLLYCSSQHRRMSEVMLSEIENVEAVDPAETPVNVRDESYRLAAGFAMGYINLGRGNETRGLADMRIVERLLAVAVGPRPVELIHILDQATAGATIAIALIFMKTGNKSVANKVDVPDTLPQFDYVRPDILLLRTMAKHLILWDEISADPDWIKTNLPVEYASVYQMRNMQSLKSEHMPFYYILAGLLWSVGLRYAGSANKEVCNFLLSYLDRFIRICKLPAHRYDAKLTRNTIRNCQDLVALACATVMAGTGDLNVMRRLRSLHGRTNADTPYGSHLAAHMAMGALFLGAGTFTFSTSNLAIASLICAFYPLFPSDVTDNKAHLQPFRHLWVLAAEARCVVTREVDTSRPIRVPITLRLRDGTTRSLTAPCLLPELDTIAQVETSGTEYWPITLDFARNPQHLASFKLHQTLHVRKRPPGSARVSTFSGTFISLNDSQTQTLTGYLKLFRSIFALPFFKSLDLPLTDLGLVLPEGADFRAGMWKDAEGSVVDAKVGLALAARTSNDRDALWGLRVLFKWAEVQSEQGNSGVTWLGREIVRDLRGWVEERGRRIREEQVE